MTVTIRTVTPVECTPWCDEGTGHPDAEDANEQGCYTGERRIDLPRIPDQGAPERGHVAVYLYRDVHPDSSGRTVLETPHIEVYASDSETISLSVGEAQSLGGVLLELANTARRS